MPGTVLVTGVGRRAGIGAGIAMGLAADGWDLVLNHWAPYDDRLGLQLGPSESRGPCHGLRNRCRDDVPKPGR